MMFYSTLIAEEKIEITKMREELKEIKTLVDGSKCKDALPRLRKLMLLKPDDEATNFYLGMCAREEKSFDEALAAFERMAIINPDNKRVRLEIARLYFEEGSHKQAEDEFNAILADKDIPEAVKNSVRQYIAAIQQAQKKHTINGAFIAGVKFDSNTNQEIGLHKDYYLPSLRTSLPGGKPKSDLSHSEILALFHEYDIGEKGGYVWKNEGILFYQGMQRYTEKNLLFTSLSSGIEHRFETDSIYFPITAEYIHYGKEPLMKTMGVGAKMSNKLTDSINLSTEYGVKKQFYNERKDSASRDAEQNSIKQTYLNRLNKHFESPMLDIALTIAFEKTQEMTTEQNKVESREDVSSYAREYKMETSKEFFKNHTQSIGYAYKESYYTDTDELFFEKRNDISRKYKLSDRYKYSDTIMGTLEYEHTDNSSNFGNKNYDQDIYSISVMKLF